MKNNEKEALDRERWEILQQVEDLLELPVLILGFVWLVLLFIEFIWGLSPFLEAVFIFTWGVFVLDFTIRFFLAPAKLAYLSRNWLTAISLVVPAFRVFRVFQVIRLLRLTQTVRGLHFVQVVSSLNRGMRALRASMGRRGFGYVIILTVMVTLFGAAGMLVFERGIPEAEIQTYGEALWWTAMTMTTLGSGIWPQTPEGRLLGFLLSLYAFGVFGYTTAALATFFIGQEAEHEDVDLANKRNIENLNLEIRSLRQEINLLLEHTVKGDDGPTLG
jgi:voltage-gated potassium channel